VSMRWRTLTRRPAPPGLWPATVKSDLPPDGWETVDPSVAERLTIGIDAALLRFTAAAARGTSRRQFLARTGGVGLALGLATSGVLTRADRARADGAPCFGSSPCGPNPICAGTYCNFAECAYGKPEVQRRRYDTSNCDGDGVRWWLEHCCNTPYNGHAYCVDCCAPTGTSTCLYPSSCNNKCICRTRADTC
jgi:hypothetical protein